MRRPRHPVRAVSVRVRSRARRAKNALSRRVRPRLGRVFSEAWTVVSLPASAIAILGSPRIHSAYRITLRRKLALAWRMYRNTRQVFTGTSYKAHLAMAAKLFEVPPDVEGDVVECGCFYGGSTANLSLACALVGRRLHVYDSFEGLPPPTEGDKYATDETEGFLAADIDRVRRTVSRLGDISVCEFHKGWFEETLPHHDSPVVLCFLDVDYQASLRDCILNLWPHLTPKGYVFIDEYVLVDYCALFFSERFWRMHFDRDPPGLIGAGTGVGVGEFYLGPPGERFPLQAPRSVAYTRKDFSGAWNYFPEDAEDQTATAGAASRARTRG